MTTPSWWRDERGAVAIEVAVVAPALVALLLLVVFAGRVAEADGNVTRAASEAARAASLRQSPSAAEADAQRVAAENLESAGTLCGELQVDVDLDDFKPGGTVGVRVRCTIAMSDVALLGLPGSRTFTAASIEVVDTFRGEG